MSIFIGFMIPFIGTMLGSACVFFLKDEIPAIIQKALLGFASGVMVAASIWSLLLPSIEQSASLGNLAFIPAAIGFLLGMLFLLFLDEVIPHMHLNSDEPEGKPSHLDKSTMLLLAVTLHNIPEGMAVGVVFAGLQSSGTITVSAAFALALGIALQNFPEGAIISMPLKSNGFSKSKAFLYGTLSGAVEPIASFVTLLLFQHVTNILPYLLAFAAGAMMYVVVEELIPESAEGEHSNIATVLFALGFVIMMILDIALG